MKEGEGEGEGERSIMKKNSYLDYIPAIPGSSTWSEMDFVKDFIQPGSEKEEAKKEEEEVKKEEEEEEEEGEEADFNYLDPENIDLEYEYGLCEDFSMSNAIVNVHIILYSINMDGDVPFLKFLLELYGEQFDFPHFDFTCPSNVNNPSSFVGWIWDSLSGKKREEIPEEKEEDEGESAGHVYFVNECLKRIMTMVDMSDHSNPNLLKTMYKGFMKDKTKPNSVYAFFDIDELDLEETEHKRVWVILDEIINKKKVLGFAVEPSIIPLFSDSYGLSILLDKDGFKSELPYVLYLCKKEGDAYVNVYNEKPEETPYEERMTHPIFGKFYFFSTKPLNLEDSRSIFQLQRYAGFTQNPLYLLKDTSDPLFQDPELDDEFKGESNKSIYFREKNGDEMIYLWCIKSKDDFTLL